MKQTKRLEAKREGSQDLLRKKSSQVSIKAFLESRKAIAEGQDLPKNKLEVGVSLKPATNLGSQGRATLGAQGMFRKAEKSSLLPGTPGKEGRELLGRNKGQNKGRRSLEKRLGPREKGSGNSRGEKRSSEKGDRNPGLKVKSIRDWFEGRQKAPASRKVSDTEEVNPGKSQLRTVRTNAG